jgi:uncharacterized protein (TIGR03083 family)
MAPLPADLPFDARAVLAAEGRMLSAAARAAGLDTPVAHLPGWTVRDVVAHTTGVHRWAVRVLEAGSMDVPGIAAPDLGGDDLLAHYDDGVALLIGALDAADADKPVPNFHPGTPTTVRFWWRRQAHETTIHRWDVEAAVGASAAHAPIDEAVALDGIDELLTGFAVRGKGHELAGAVVVGAGARAWRMAPSVDKPGRLTAERLDPPPPVSDVSGPPADVLLALWKRLGPAHPTLRRAGADADAFLQGPLTP